MSDICYEHDGPYLTIIRDGKRQRCLVLPTWLPLVSADGTVSTDVESSNGSESDDNS